jgi:EpsI family protein
MERQSFERFPMRLGDWRGRTSVLDPEVASVLAADDYIKADYFAPGAVAPVNFFVAYYDNQTDGDGIHSPEVCLPVGGWEIFLLEERTINIPDTPYGAFAVNRAIIEKSQQRQLVYYWFEQRGKRMTNDVLAKISVIYDGIVHGRTDGALVRFVTYISPDETPAQADARIMEVMRRAMATLPAFIPL